MIYNDFDKSVKEADLEGLLSHWDFKPPPGTLLKMLQGSSIAIVVREPSSPRVCAYVAALTDHSVCGYISALEVRPEYRKRGIGTVLLNRATERLDVYGIYLSCAAAMIPFYEAVGFKQVAGMSKRRLPASDA
jgi:GNAT superfamily N-acetyltransferase